MFERERERARAERGRRSIRRAVGAAGLGATALLLTACPPTTGGGGTSTTTSSIDPAQNHAPVIASFAPVTSSAPAPLTTAFKWAISDVDGQTLTCGLDLDENGTFEVTVNNCNSSSIRSASFNVTGVHSVTLRVSDGVAAPVLAITTVNVGAASADQFAITVRLNGTMTPSQQAAFTTAATRWAQVIKTGQSNISLNIAANDCGTGAPAFNGTIDDIMIDATIDPIDGVGAILGQAGPCYTRVSNGLPVYGVMEFDSADVVQLQNAGDFNAVILHEMGHVLGFGTVWTSPMFSGAGTSNPVITSATTVGAWQAIGGVGSVPVENSGGPGTQDSHWRESVFNGELMTGYIDPGANPMSKVTIACLADMGYGVDLTAADPYALPGLKAGEPVQGTRYDIEPVTPKGAV
jgi:hypothetical protein